MRGLGTHNEGITTALPAGRPVDPRIFTITVKQMLDHRSGWDWRDPASGGDPAFKLREIAEALGLDRAVDQRQYLRYQLQFPLQHAPGTFEEYCNYCYDVLGAVVAKASGISFIDYLNEAVARPSGAGRMAISPTVGKRLAGEVARYYNSGEGLSSIYITCTKPYPEAYSGDDGILEISQADGGVATSAQSLVAFMNAYAVARFGTPPPHLDPSDYYEGEIAGTSSFMRQMSNGKDYAMVINTNQFKPAGAFNAVQLAIERHLDPAAAVAPIARRPASPRPHARDTSTSTSQCPSPYG